MLTIFLLNEKDNANNKQNKIQNGIPFLRIKDNK